VVPIAAGDRGSLTLELRATLLRPGPVAEVSTERGKIEQPKIDHGELNTTLSLRSGRASIVGSLGHFSEGVAKPRRAVLILRSTVIGLEE
jgi:hypothetical protein